MPALLPQAEPAGAAAASLPSPILLRALHRLCRTLPTPVRTLHRARCARDDGCSWASCR